MRTGRGFGMVLNGKNRQFLMSESLDSLVIEVQMSQFAAIGHRVPPYGKAVILGSDLYFSGLQVLHRMICSAVTEFQFIGFASECKRKKLIPKANAKDRIFGFSYKLLHGFNSIFYRIGITGSVGEKNSIRFLLANFIIGNSRWHNGQPRSMIGQLMQDVMFYPIIDHHDMLR